MSRPLCVCVFIMKSYKYRQVDILVSCVVPWERVLVWWLTWSEEKEYKKLEQREKQSSFLLSLKFFFHGGFRVQIFFPSEGTTPKYILLTARTCLFSNLLFPFGVSSSNSFTFFRFFEKRTIWKIYKKASSWTNQRFSFIVLFCSSSFFLFLQYQTLLSTSTQKKV